MLKSLLVNVVLFVLVKVPTRIEAIMILARKVPQKDTTAYKGVHWLHVLDGDLYSIFLLFRLFF